MLLPTEAGPSPQAPMRAVCSAPRQAPITSTIGFLQCQDSNRTYRIPDVPSTSTVMDIKQWYIKNVTSQSDTRSLVVIHNNLPLDDGTQVWQLAQGQGQFAVTMLHQQLSPRTITLYVDTSLGMAPLQVRLSTDSSILYAKQRIMEILNLPMATATSPQTILVFPPATLELRNECTLSECQIPENARLALSLPQSAQYCFQGSPPQSPPQPDTYGRIQQIWAGGTNEMVEAPRAAPPSASHALLPAALLEDDEEAPSHCTQQQSNNPINPVPKANNGGRNRGRRSHSPPSDRSQLSSDQLQHLAANFRTKLCRNGPNCKFGRNCWFAHNGEELRKPSDPLPNNLPAVHKLERYSNREGKQDRQ